MDRYLAVLDSYRVMSDIKGHIVHFAPSASFSIKPVAVVRGVGVGVGGRLRHILQTFVLQRLPKQTITCCFSKIFVSTKDC